MAVLDDVKTLLKIEDGADIDDMLNILIKNSSAQLVSLLNPGVEEVPEELEYIVTEVTVSRYNRLGNEGMSQYTQEGESITYNADDMAPYLDAINAWNAAQDDAQKGVLRFL